MADRIKRDAHDRLATNLAVTRRLGAFCVLSGTVIFGVAMLLHPLTLDPYDPSVALSAAAEVKWVLDHWALTVGMILLAIGLVTFHVLIGSMSRPEFTEGRSKGYSPFAVAATLVSLTLWVALFTFEATGWAVLGKHLTDAVNTAGRIDAPGTALSVMAHALWRTSLGSGYVAGFLLAAAVLMWGLDLANLGLFPRWFGWLGVVGGTVTALAQPTAWLFPGIALWVLVPGAVLLGVWFFGAAWFLWPRAAHKSPGSA